MPLPGRQAEVVQIVKELHPIRPSKYKHLILCQLTTMGAYWERESPKILPLKRLEVQAEYILAKFLPFTTSKHNKERSLFSRGIRVNGLLIILSLFLLLCSMRATCRDEA